MAAPPLAAAVRAAAGAEWAPALRRLGVGELRQRRDDALAALQKCELCPRRCKVDRLKDHYSICNTGRHARVSAYFDHRGEEAVLQGWHGSGTIFFSHCNLRCVFCQNWETSQSRKTEARWEEGGGPVDAARLASMMLELQARGCHNVNLVTPEHVVPQVIEGLVTAAEQGLHIPVVYNTSAYDSMESLRLLDGLVDIYMPDFKFWEPESARRLAKAKDYPEVARESIIEMHRQVGDLAVGDDGLARRGVLLRHLVMPGLADEGSAIVRWVAETLGQDSYVNIMAQYRPEHRVGQERNGEAQYGEIDRRPTHAEVRAVRDAARAAGLWRLDGEWSPHGRPLRPRRWWWS